MPATQRIIKSESPNRKNNAKIPLKPLTPIMKNLKWTHHGFLVLRE